MKLFLKSILILVIFLGGNFAHALCDVSKKPNSTECEVDSSGICCIVESYQHDKTCYDIWCMSYGQGVNHKECEWTKIAEPLCT
jgi:hypothetical protein